MKSRPLKTELFHAGGWTDKTFVTKVAVLLQFFNAPKSGLV